MNVLSSQVVRNTFFGYGVAVALLASVSAQENADRQLFDKVNAHLDLGGRFYLYANAKDKLRELISQGDELFEQVVEEIPDEVPEEVRDLDVEAILLSLGLHQAEAIGFSSAVHGPGYANKGFLAVDGPRQGLLKLAGGEAKPFEVLKRAPANADLAFEIEFALSTFAEVAATLDKELASVIGEGAVLEALRKPIPNTPYSPELLMKELSGRLSGFAMISDKKLELPEDVGMEIPAIDLVLTHDRGRWLYGQVKPLSAMLPQEMVERVDNEVFERILLQLPPEQSLGFYAPVLHLDKASGALHIASRVEALDMALADGDKLAAAPDFQEVTKGFPAAGNFMGFVSENFYDQLSELYTAPMIAGMSEGGLSPELAEKLSGWMGFAADHPTAFVFSNSEDGIGFISQSSEPLGATMMMIGAITPVAILATVATPMIGKARSTARTIPEIKRMQSILIGLALYSGEHGGAFPEKLEDLVPDIFEDEALVRSTTGEVIEYVPGFTDSSPGNKIILHMEPRGLPNKRLVGHLDGSAHSISKAEFEANMAAQGKP